MNKKTFFLPVLGMAMGLGVQTQAAAAQIKVTVENLTGTDGLYFTPVWTGFHDGSFDTFDLGASASASLEMLAEGGDTSGLEADFTNAAAGQQGVIAAPTGVAPIFEPGESASSTFNIDPMSERFFSFASMVIPSNDAFIGNPDAMAYEIFDATGVFTGAVEIIVAGSEVWDAGTELNDGQGAPFSANGGTSTSENELIGQHAGLGVLLGSTTAAGTAVNADFTQSGFQLARITVSQVPEPHLFAMLGLGLGMMRIAGKRRGRDSNAALSA